MQVISPVLAGTIPTPPPIVNFTAGAEIPATTDIADTSAAADARRYSKFDRTASETGDADMSFGDVLDMLNPLQHIPVVSSIYRAITGDKINPVARVAGDIMYGGVLGVASAIASGVGAVADSVMEAETGKDITGTVYASLFGDDKTDADTTQIASQNTDSNPAPISTIPPPASPASSLQPPAPTADNVPAPLLAQGIPLTRNKLPYGGAIAPVKSLQQQNMAMAMAASTTGIRIGNMVYANNMKNGAHSLPPAIPAATPSTAPAPAETTAPAYLNALATPVPLFSSPVPATPAATATDANVTAAAVTDTTIPPALKDDAMIMRALGLYRSTAERPATSATGTN